jgi:hypothetical protein
MRRKLLHGIFTGCIATLGVVVAGASAQTQDAKPGAKPAAVDPKTIWPANLEKIAGRYTFVQVASPGGLWERGGEAPRQIALPDCPQELQDLLAKSEIVISDIAKPTQISAEERNSPSGRGKLRFYREDGTGKLTLKNLPGIGGTDKDKGQFSGLGEFSINHQSHSNPSAAGVLEQRKRQEPTWGAAALDYADFNVSVPEVAGDDKDTPPVIGNARILRSGIEIFAFVEWEGKGPRGDRTYQGCVRLAKLGAIAPPADPGKPPRTALAR